LDRQRVIKKTVPIILCNSSGGSSGEAKPNLRGEIKRREGPGGYNTS